MSKGKGKNKKTNAAKIVEQWTEMDLTAMAREGILPRAFAVEEQIAQIEDLLAAGRFPLLTGESGVGKTALVHELANRAVAGQGPAVLQGRRILQISIRRRVGALKHPSELRPEMEKLVRALKKLGPKVVPFFRDFHFGWFHDIEPLLLSVAAQTSGVVLAEGEEEPVENMLECWRELQHYFAVLRIDEPDLGRMATILSCWNEHQAAEHGRRFEPEALDEALHLAHRFLVRDCHPRRALTLLEQINSDRTGVALGAPQVIERFCRRHRVPRLLIDPRIDLDLAVIRARFGQRILGQPQAVETMVDMIAAMKTRLTDERRPFGVFLFVGPTGVGKTHVAQLLAEFLFNKRERLIRFNMADFQTPQAAYSLFGDPDDHRPRQIQGLLTLRIMSQPCGVLLLDEFEKANPLVHDRFLQLMDEGCFINGRGQTISCRSTIVIATSNAGSEVHAGNTLGFKDVADRQRIDREVDRLLSREFRVEFLNRFDRIVHFHCLGRQDTRAIALGELQRLEHRAGLRQRGYKLEIDDTVLNWLADNGHDPRYGARFLRRAVERHVTTALAAEIVAANPSTGARISLSVRENRIQAKTLRPDTVFASSTLKKRSLNGKKKRRLRQKLEVLPR
ncbi:MAG: ATP-dependent Clp protease ATP-binding subunit [Pirellulales bacterium]|nr:ATP-dependent Clp protease ATP-binding subunit [Pirellulales bacterium]